MGLETANFLDDLNVSNPDGAVDPKNQGDNHLRLIKSVLKATFPGFAGRFNRAQSKSGDYTGLLNDSHSLLVFTAAATLNLTAAATLGNGWASYVYASGGTVTVDPSGSETVNGAATAAIKKGRMGLLLCDGSGFALFEMGQQNSSVPAGAVADFAGATAPDGWLLCYGQAVSRTTYAALFDAIGTQFGTGDGSTTFNLPDCRGRVAAGKDDMGGSAANRLTNGESGITGTTLGAAGGDQRISGHTHSFSGTTGSENAAHTHSQQANTQLQDDSGEGLSWVGGTSIFKSAPGGTTGTQSANHQHAYSGTTGSTGAGSSANVQPTIVFNKIIKT